MNFKLEVNITFNEGNLDSACHAIALHFLNVAGVERNSKKLEFIGSINLREATDVSYNPGNNVYTETSRERKVKCY